MMGKILKIFREQSKTNPAIQKVEEVYEWASQLTGENADNVKSDFYVTADARKLAWKVNHANGGVIGVIGLQGIGKTRLLKDLAGRLKEINKRETLFLSWTPKWEELLQERHSEYIRGKIGLDGIPFASIYGFVASLDDIFIDLPDYSKKNRGDMNRDLEAIQLLWKKVEEDPRNDDAKKTTFILGIQKEMFGGHFFFGKMDNVELSALKPEELVEAYKAKWKTNEPFTEEALFLLAQLSRGIFRRFFKYIQRSIEKTILSKNVLFPITAEVIKEAVTTEQLAKDMDLELTDLFQNNREQKMLAIRLLTCLREHKEINQKALAELLDIDEATVSRLMRKMIAHDYIKRERGQQTEWKLTLVE